MPSPRKAPSWQLLYAAFAAVVGCFLTAALVTDLAARSIEQSAARIGDVTVPSVQHLAAARADLRHLDLVLRAHLEGRAFRRPQSTNDLRRARDQLDRDVSAYLDLAAPTRDPGGRTRLRQGMNELDIVIRDILRRLDDHAVDPSGSFEEEMYTTQMDQVRDAIASAVDASTVEARSLALSIENAHGESRRVALILDGVSVLLAGAAALSVVTTSRRHTALLEEHNRVIERRANELEMFAGTVAHDILSPLGTVAMGIELTRKQLDDPAERVWLDRTLSALARVRSIVDALLGFASAAAKPEAGARADVGRVLRDVVEGMRPTTDAEAIALELHVDDDGEVACAPGLLTSVTSNLIANAVKYMGDSAVRRIVVRARRDGSALRIVVEDTGPGLLPGMAENVFEPYVRGPGVKQPGVGLGLATVRRIALAHGGTAGVHSKPGAGCTFWVELPEARMT